MKHTKGPWEAIDKEVWPIPQGNYPRVCTCVDGPWAKANARLIAAAPDLLEACKGAFAALTQNKAYPADIDAAKMFLKKAISRSEGR